MNKFSKYKDFFKWKEEQLTIWFVVAKKNIPHTNNWHLGKINNINERSPDFVVGWRRRW